MQWTEEVFQRLHCLHGRVMPLVHTTPDGWEEAHLAWVTWPLLLSVLLEGVGAETLVLVLLVLLRAALVVVTK